VEDGPVRRATAIDSFLASPLGRYLRGRTHLVWCHGPALLGSAHWGRATETDLRRLGEALEVVHAGALCVPFDAVTDARHVESTPSVVNYARSLGHLAERMEVYGRLLRRHAVIHGGGLAGSVVAGSLPLLRPRHVWRLFTDARAAFAWLKNPAADAARLEVEALLDDAVGAPPAVAALRDYLGQRGGAAMLVETARALGVSPRSLQRSLTRESTSFRGELSRARSRAAMQLVLESDLKLSAVARQLGFSSLGAFSRHYLRHTGELPSRARSRVGAPGGPAGAAGASRS
jgi:AraC-like DNA-binding protein